MQGGEESGSHHAGILGGILIAFSGIFDWACDIETRDRHRLVELVNEETLDRAFDVHARPYVERSLRAKSSDPVVVQVICALIDTFIARCDLLRRHHDDAVWVELRHTVLTSYHAQMGTLSEIFQVGPGPLAYNILFDKGALLTWVVALTSALMVPDARLLELDRLRPAMFEFGKAVWLADDLVDIEDDLANGMWNYVVLELDKEMNILRLSAGERPDPDRTFRASNRFGGHRPSRGGNERELPPGTRDDGGVGRAGWCVSQRDAPLDQQPFFLTPIRNGSFRTLRRV